ncbi:MAG: hypothetical protein IPK83_21100 [Planctomycetes bacterium]|nr:hypothetical protein [Planctomycetota bacterium]
MAHQTAPEILAKVSSTASRQRRTGAAGAGRWAGESAARRVERRATIATGAAGTLPAAWSMSLSFASKTRRRARGSHARANSMKEFAAATGFILAGAAAFWASVRVQARR